jgi:hypothetical protein
MAQLWTEIRSSDLEDRRAFALALADRFAPALSVKFEETTGLDGPEFIRLVRSLIEMDGEDINHVVTDLERLVDNPALPADGITVAEPIETADRLTDKSGRDEQMNAVFEQLVDAADEVGEPLAASTELASLTPEIDPIPKVTPAMAFDDQEPQPVEKLTPHKPAIEKMDDIDEDHEANLQVAHGSGSQPGSFDAVDRTRDRDSVPVRPNALRAAEVAHYGGLVGAAADGWRRRRVISSLIRDGRVGVGEALVLSDQLSRPSDVGWIIGDLIERDLTLSDRAMLASRELPAHLRRRLEHS